MKLYFISTICFIMMGLTTMPEEVVDPYAGEVGPVTSWQQVCDGELVWGEPLPVKKPAQLTATLSVQASCGFQVVTSQEVINGLNYLKLTVTTADVPGYVAEPRRDPDIPSRTTQTFLYGPYGSGSTVHWAVVPTEDDDCDGLEGDEDFD